LCNNDATSLANNLVVVSSDLDTNIASLEYVSKSIPSKDGKNLVSFSILDGSKTPLESRNLYGIYVQTKPQLRSSIFLSSKEDQS
jgi:hypothetical protein